MSLRRLGWIALDRASAQAEEYLLPMTTTVAATFCATVVDEWVRAGVTTAFVAPGSRSTPMALALMAEERLTVHVFIDERS